MCVEYPLYGLKRNLEKGEKERFPRKRNQRMPKKGGFLAPKRSSFSLCIYHLDWTDLFLSAACRERMCSLNLGVSRQAASLTSGSLYQIYLTKHSTNLKLVITENDLIIYFNALSGKRNYFYWSRKTFLPQNSF